jgi:acyl-CoA thioesterase-1
VFFVVQPLHANNTADSEIRLVVLGDSLAAGYGLQEADSFPRQLESALRLAGNNVRVINAGVSGDTTAGGLARLDWVLRDNPDLVIVELGANDALRGLNTEMTRSNLDAVLVKLKQGGVKVILAGMHAPRNMGERYVTSFDRIYPALAEKHGITLYPFFLKGVALNPALNQPDGIHPNGTGVRVIVKNILPLVVAELEKK